MVMLSIHDVHSFMFKSCGSSLDLATDHLVDKFFLSSAKESIGMAVSTLFTSMQQPFETPQIALPLEGLCKKGEAKMWMVSAMGQNRLH